MKEVVSRTNNQEEKNMQQKFAIREKVFIFRDLNPDIDADFQYLDDFYREMKKCNDILDEKKKDKAGVILARRAVVELSVEPKLSMSDIKNGGIIEDILSGKVLTWVAGKIENIVEQQKKN